VDARRTDRLTIALLALMYAILAANVVLCVFAPLPAVVHVLVAAAAIHLAFTIWHEAVHLNVSRRTWVNNLVGVLGMFPYMTPYFMQRWIHLRHHARLNEPDDPNVIYTDGPFRTILLRYPRALRYARQIMRDDPRRGGEKLADTIFALTVAAVYFAAWWNGYLFDALILWFVPVVVAKLVMDWYINYIPHAGLPAHRFKGTRVLDVAWLTPLVLEHNYHAVHHLWPNIPWHRYHGVFREKREYLHENGVPIESRVFGAGARTGTVAHQGAHPR
jgi:beta-carotene hydroxylase